MAFFSTSRSLNTDASMSLLEYTMFTLGYLVQYGWGIFYLFYNFNESFVFDDTEEAKNIGRFIVVYLLVIPFITSVLSALGKWIDDKGKFTAPLII